ncbi:MAG TPA: aminotransferase class I/II-fold pyridoxal phosphate-dependent enzyme, partial [Anaerolineae bacterium]|nr:aminotransferase class I/II-fold pyridoxal phosphate-dependent enzyme [Anaerolineae bacterium]
MRSFISNRVQQIPPSGIRRFFDIAATMDNVISLGIGEPDFVTPRAVLDAGLASLEAGHTHYTSNSGTIELRQAISRQLKRLYGVDYDPALEILVTVGVSEAMYLALTAIINPGDEVIVPQPCFVSYMAEVFLAGGTPVPIATRVENNFQVTAEEIEAAITRRTKALLIGYPCNPTGAVLERETMEEIAKVARKHDILIVSDEIYDRLVYGIEHTCVPSIQGLWERTILLGGFSKAYAMTGWRLGYAAAPPEILGAMSKVHQYTIMSAPTVAQEAGLTALEKGEEAVEEMRQRYDRRRRLIVDGLNSLGLKCFEPRGAFYAFPSVRGTGM